MPQTNHSSPHWPKAAVSAAIFRHGQVLLAERGKPPLIGVWSLPGGHVELGETVRAAALREVEEETSVRAKLAGHLDVHDVIIKHGSGKADGSGANAIRAHYVLNIFYGLWLAGEPVAASDCRTARFVDLEALSQYPLTRGAEEYIRRAHATIYE